MRVRHLCAALVWWLAACNDGGGKTLVHVRVDASGLTQADRDSIVVLRVDVTGDTTPIHHDFAVAHQLSDGVTTFPYHPGISDGLLVFHIAVLNGASVEVSSAERQLEVRKGQETTEVIMLGAQYDGGMPDAADMCATASCGLADGCCPSGCAATADPDCSGCGNGRLDPGETCDPPGSCPVCDDQNDCTTDTSTGSAATCDLVCTHTAKTCSVAGKDRCCPAGCTAGNDSDCAGCGDGTVDPAAGETCDPQSSCPTAASCVSAQCQDIKTYVGAPATCNAKCVTTVRPCSGAVTDGCCPPGCNTSLATRDADCAASCGNGIIEGSETCDPAASCPSAAACVSDANNVRVFTGSAATCDARCTTTARTCGPVDTFCPAGCTAATDSDCAGCGNGRVEAGLGETCDPPGSCPTAAGCVSDADNLRTFSGSAAACTAACTATPRPCGPADTFCPTGCGPTQDVDCPGCGNGIVEPALGEVCDGNCPICPSTSACHQTTGSAATCDLRCNVDITACNASRDGCCPYQSSIQTYPAVGGECSNASDADCAGRGWQIWGYVGRRTPRDVNATTPPGVTARYAGCVFMRVYGLPANGGSSYMFTTCGPGGTIGTGNTIITNVYDSNGRDISPTGFLNGRCSNPNAIPNLIGWSCTTDVGPAAVSCSSNNTGGWILPALPLCATCTQANIYIEVCPASPGATFDTPFNILFNGAGNPSLG